MSDNSLLLSRAKSAVISRDFPLATRLYRQLLRDSPKDINILNQLGELYIKSGKDEQALGIYRRISEINPEEIAPYITMGGIYRRLGQYEDSIAVLERALVEAGENPEISYNLGFTYKQMGQLDDAVSCFEEAIELNPDDVLAYNHLGSIYSLQNQNEKALQSYLRGLSIDANHPVLLMNIAKVYEATGDFEKATSSYEKALRSKPLWADIIESYVTLLLKIKKEHKACALVSRAAKNAPQDKKIAVIFNQLKQSVSPQIFNSVCSGVESEENVQNDVDYEVKIDDENEFDENKIAETENETVIPENVEEPLESEGENQIPEIVSQPEQTEIFSDEVSDELLEEVSDEISDDENFDALKEQDFSDDFDVFDILAGDADSSTENEESEENKSEENSSELESEEITGRPEETFAPQDFSENTDNFCTPEQTEEICERQEEKTEESDSTTPNIQIFVEENCKHEDDETGDFTAAEEFAETDDFAEQEESTATADFTEPDESTATDDFAEQEEMNENQPEEKNGGEEILELFKTLRNLIDFLPDEDKKEFLSSRKRILLDYIISRLSGEPGLLKKASMLNKNNEDSISESEDEKSASLMLKESFGIFTSLIESLPDEKLKTTLENELRSIGG